MSDSERKDCTDLSSVSRSFPGALWNFFKPFAAGLHEAMYSVLFFAVLFTSLNALMGLMIFFISMLVDSLESITVAMEAEQEIKIDFSRTQTFLESRVGPWLTFLVSYTLWKFYREIAGFSRTSRSND